MAVTERSEESNGRCCSICCFKRKPCSQDAVEIQSNTDDSVDASNLIYSGDLAPLSPGDVITIQGRIGKNCERFSINLLSVPEKNPALGIKDVALHLNPRISQRYVVRNSKLGGVWCSEETAAPTPFPLTRENVFTVNIFIGDESFFIQINGVHFCQYAFRVPLSKIVSLEVKGSGVTVEEVLRGHAPSYPSGISAPPKAGLKPSDEILAWDNPCTCVLEEGLRRGKQVVVCGRIKILPHSFSINLQSSVHLWPHPDIALHVNPRFMQSSKQQVIWNYWYNGWGKELRTPTSELVPGGIFQLRIQREDDQYSVWVKDILIGIYKFHCSPDDVKAVYVYGDVAVHDIYVEDAPLAVGSFEEDLIVL